MRPTRAWKRGNPARDGNHPVDADPHQPPEHAVEAERHRKKPEQARRHHQRRDHRHRREIGQHAIGGDAVEVEGGIRRGGKARDERSEDQHHHFPPAPQRDAGCGRAIRCRKQAGHAELHQHDQPKRCRKGHLEARSRISNLATQSGT
jgi:hypothetical protein